MKNKKKITSKAKKEFPTLHDLMFKNKKAAKHSKIKKYFDNKRKGIIYGEEGELP